ncbi:MAG TPA: endopeptidase La [Thermotogota bacterium]|nr:endopeptidase La [Thermotogota bacterium]HPJ87926.1 endopeptidase La [Thermotogota bacterium]HPR95019.1 endopeptidase La [Thermotogota bacterium]
MAKFKALEDFAAEGKGPEDIPNELPLIPMRTNMLIYPGAVMPFYIGREKSLNALEDSIEDKGRFLFLVSQKEIQIDEPEIDDLYEYGIVARIMQLMKLPDNSFKVLAEGVTRARRYDTVMDEDCLVTKIEILEAKYRNTKSLEVLVRRVKEEGRRFFNLTRRIPNEALQSFDNTDDPDKFADLIASMLPIKLEEKQMLLEIVHPKQRLELLLEILLRENELLKIEEDLERKVKGKIEQNQKEYYLREKMKTIKEELDGSGDPEIMEYKERIEQATLPEKVEEKALQQLERLEKSPAFSAESTVIRTYLDWLLELPWFVESEDIIDIKQAKKVLDEDHYGLDEVKKRILEYLAARSFSKGLKAPILCLVGPPGVGKTSLGKSLARAMNRKFVRMSLGGMRDEAEIRGHRRTYVGALPGRIMQLIRESGVKNPLILLDEIDKLGQSFQGDPGAALLEVLDPEQNKSFTDHYLETEFDLSGVIFITTANVLYTIPPALLDRMETIEIPGYTRIEKEKIATQYILPEILEEHNMKNKVNVTTHAVNEIIDSYTREAGVRNLQRELASIIRKSALKLLEESIDQVKIRKGDVEELLGPARYLEDERLKKPEIGVTTGLAWTSVGGTVLQVEALFQPGKGNIQLTGQLGDVMKESSQIALSLAKVKCQDDCSEDFFEKKDLHLHFPEGAVPKDGPSAGVTILTSLVSCLKNRPVRNDIAMTGEISLRGKVFPIGGVREKVMAAYRIGIKEVILPLENQKDLYKVPDEIKEKMKFHFVETVDQVLNIALVKE